MDADAIVLSQAMLATTGAIVQDLYKFPVRSLSLPLLSLPPLLLAQRSKTGCAHGGAEILWAAVEGCHWKSNRRCCNRRYWDAPDSRECVLVCFSIVNPCGFHILFW